MTIAEEAQRYSYLKYHRGRQEQVDFRPIRVARIEEYGDLANRVHTFYAEEKARDLRLKAAEIIKHKKSDNAMHVAREALREKRIAARERPRLQRGTPLGTAI